MRGGGASKRLRAVAPALFAIAALLVSTNTLPARAAECPQNVEDARFANTSTLRAWNQVMADLGPRPTASSTHQRYIEWIETKLRGIKGLKTSSIRDSLDRWLERSTSLRIRGNGTSQALRVASAVPYSKQGAASGRLVYLPPSTPIAGADVKGKIVLRDVVPGVIQYPVFFAVAYYVHDPGLTLNYTGNYERDWASAAGRIADLEQAAAKGAAGVIFAHELPHEQVRGDYNPYAGVKWKVPAAYVGVDEAAKLRKAQGRTVDLVLRAQETPAAPTRTLVASLSGRSRERIVIQSHTDGMNAVWDNGPVSILALARYFASLPLECRPRTIEFVFTTAHLYLTKSGAVRYAKALDQAYEGGTVAFALALEHLGAKEYLPVPRTSGPGRMLKPTGSSEPFVVFVHESPVSLQAVMRSVVTHDLRRTFVLRGADAPQVGLPPHRSYGGEGGPYHERLVPTIAAITGPTVLFKPAFGMQTVDFELMRRQTLAFGDVVLSLQGVPREAIAGADTAYRAGRDATAAE